MGNDESAARNFVEVDRLYALALDHHPDLRFISTEELGRALRDGNSAWIEENFTVRLMAWLSRVRALRGYWKVAKLTGLPGS